MYLRFTVLAGDRGSGRKTGVLVAAHELRDRGELSPDEERQLRESLEWFNVNLNHPACLKEPENRRAISWFKPEAKKPLQQMWALVSILRDHGIDVEVHKTAHPGLVLYEDGWQVVAKPRKGTRGNW
jgi:hypothetical protein